MPIEIAIFALALAILAAIIPMVKWLRRLSRDRRKSIKVTDDTETVSEKIARQMSAHACGLFLSDYAIGITGYASTLPEKNVNELFCFYSISLKDKIVKSGRIDADTKEGLNTQLYYVNNVLVIFDELLK